MAGKFEDLAEEPAKKYAQPVECSVTAQRRHRPVAGNPP
jgi:hypothetical protein